MQDEPIRIVHYLNQFFGGIGGEQHADSGLEVRAGPVGPGLGLESALGDRGHVVETLICGDNHFNDHTEAVLASALETIEAARPDVVVAGPAFNAGRYGVACARLCHEVAERLGIPAVTALYPENPAVALCRKTDRVWILPTGDRATEMGRVLPALAAFALKVGRGEELGPASKEGYLPTGLRKLATAAAAGADRTVEMLLAKVAGNSYATEIPIETFEPVPPAEPVADLSAARLAVITTSGLVPKGNPDGFRMFDATEWRSYELPADGVFRAEDWEVIHGGFNTAYAQANPNLVLPLDVLEALEGRAFGTLDHHYYSITGVGTSLSVARRAGREIAAAMRDGGVDAALLVGT